MEQEHLFWQKNENIFPLEIKDTIPHEVHTHRCFIAAARNLFFLLPRCHSIYRSDWKDLSSDPSHGGERAALPAPRTHPRQKLPEPRKLLQTRKYCKTRKVPISYWGSSLTVLYIPEHEAPLVCSVYVQPSLIIFNFSPVL